MSNADISFALVATPGKDFRLFCDDGRARLRSLDRFVAVPWLMPWAAGVTINDTVINTGPCILADSVGEMSPTTDREVYLERVRALIKTLGETGGKTVISRVTSGRFCVDTRMVADAAIDYLHNAPADCYRCLFHTPATGTWLIVSPETLADIEPSSGTLHTMSLAGTRPAGTAGAWDEKNRREQAIVTEFILDCLRENGLTDITVTESIRRAANVEHIVSDITARLSPGFDTATFLNSLSPTPALCGYPRPVSVERIEAIEDHKRLMYGGYTAVVEGTGHIYAAITLRCARLSPEGWCVYTGGGITADSQAEAEWDESCMKAAPLVNLFTRLSHRV